jgi:hypothetical protein
MFLASYVVANDWPIAMPPQPLSQIFLMERATVLKHVSGFRTYCRVESVEGEALRTPNAGLRIRINPNPDPAFHFNADPDSGFHFNADPDPASHLIQILLLPQSDGNLRPLVVRSPGLHFEPPASIFCLHGPSRLYLSL